MVNLFGVRPRVPGDIRRRVTLRIHGPEQDRAFILHVSRDALLCLIIGYCAEQGRGGRLNDSRASEALSAQGKAKERAEAEMDSLRAEVGVACCDTSPVLSFRFCCRWFCF